MITGRARRKCRRVLHHPSDRLPRWSRAGVRAGLGNSASSRTTERRMLRIAGRCACPAVPAPRWARDVPFWTIPGTDRQLLADIWEPAAGVERTGTAIVYLYGGSWHFFDKDVLTPPTLPPAHRAGPRRHGRRAPELPETMCSAWWATCIARLPGSRRMPSATGSIRRVVVMGRSRRAPWRALHRFGPTGGDRSCAR